RRLAARRRRVRGGRAGARGRGGPAGGRRGEAGCFALRVGAARVFRQGRRRHPGAAGRLRAAACGEGPLDAAVRAGLLGLGGLLRSHQGAGPAQRARPARRPARGRRRGRRGVLVDLAARGGGVECRHREGVLRGLRRLPAPRGCGGARGRHGAHEEQHGPRQDGLGAVGERERRRDLLGEPRGRAGDGAAGGVPERRGQHADGAPGSGSAGAPGAGQRALGRAVRGVPRGLRGERAVHPARGQRGRPERPLADLHVLPERRLGRVRARRGDPPVRARPEVDQGRHRARVESPGLLLQRLVGAPRGPPRPQGAASHHHLVPGPGSASGLPPLIWPLMLRAGEWEEVEEG
ncbi:unnamed protein product, partial [Prorocentrum cordatum]